MVERLTKLDIRTAGGTPEEFGKLFVEQIATWREVLAKAGVKPE